MYDKYNIFFILTILFVFYFIWNFDKKIIENYDDKLIFESESNLDDENNSTEKRRLKCAKICNSQSKCKAFVWNDPYCYISMKRLLGKPYIGLYKDDYDPQTHGQYNKFLSAPKTELQQRPEKPYETSIRNYKTEQKKAQLHKDYKEDQYKSETELQKYKSDFYEYGKYASILENNATYRTGIKTFKLFDKYDDGSIIPYEIKDNYPWPVLTSGNKIAIQTYNEKIMNDESNKKYDELLDKRKKDTMLNKYNDEEINEAKEKLKSIETEKDDNLQMKLDKIIEERDTNQKNYSPSKIPQFNEELDNEDKFEDELEDEFGDEENIYYVDKMDDEYNSKIFYRKTNKFNKGSYMKSFNCVDGVKFEDCANYCSENKGCKGFEWNPEYEYTSNLHNKKIYKVVKNICCPKKTIGEYIDRQNNESIYNKYKNGNFYYKYYKKN